MGLPHEPQKSRRFFLLPPPGGEGGREQERASGWEELQTPRVHPTRLAARAARHPPRPGEGRELSMSRVIIHTDGACSGNPGPGGWGAIIRDGDKITEMKGGEAATTNNRMELLAAISALEALPGGTPAELHTDSQYLRDGITQWMHNWKKNGWR